MRRSLLLVGVPLLAGARAIASPQPPTTLALRTQDPGEVPVTIKELDVVDAIREFKAFQERLGRYRDEIGAGREVARETSQILAELRETATVDNQYNEGPILEAVTGYVDGVLAKQVGLVDFLESQRYRISYYANKMASSVRPEDLAVLFGTEAQNDNAIRVSVAELSAAEQAVANFVDGLPPGQIDRATFRPHRSMPADTRKKLDRLLYTYQQQRGALELAKKRLQLVRAAKRRGQPQGAALEIDSELLVGQMFGTLDRIRLQMSMDLLFLEQMLEGYSRSTRTHEILSAFQSLVEMQGDLEGPSPELSSVLDWLQDSSLRRLSLGASTMARPGVEIPRYSELLREAYQGARGGEE
ncbi:MAG: hypothetical protein GY711_11535 [bacterium]|nr:hypothetical protein [bacterium]